MKAQLEALTRVADPGQRARQAGNLIDEHQTMIAELSRLRREALDEMLSSGMTQTQIAEAIGMTRARVGQLLTSGPRPERAFLGTGTITIAVGGKYEAGKDKPGVAVSEGMLATYERLSTLARSLNLKTEYEVVPPPGLVNLNRTNLIVCGSPRILPFAGQVLDSDTNLGFGNHEDEGWYLVNHVTGEKFRSPADTGEPRDYAYVGRLPRPDGRGTFLYLAGIHAEGTQGAGRYLEERLDELYKEVKTRRFSQLIACTYNPKTREITATEALTPIYRHEGVG